MTFSGGEGGDVRVLVVEDSEDQRELLRANFERAGCAVTAVKNAEDAISSYLVDAPELAVIDLILPGMDGWQLIEQIRQDVPGCAIVVTSVLDSRKFPEATASLPKPFTREQIIAVLRECVPRWWKP
ncbi:MAG: response regulator [Actinomycetota bacterium]|nr:response regulator [Actinomycetota bacterium]